MTSVNFQFSAVVTRLLSVCHSYIFCFLLNNKGGLREEFRFLACLCGKRRVAINIILFNIKGFFFIISNFVERRRVNNQKIIAHFFNHVCTKRTLFVQYHSMWLDTASSKLKRMIGCKVLMDWKATVKDTENFWTCKEYVFEAVIMLLTAAALCNDNSHSMAQKEEEAKIWTRNTSNASTYVIKCVRHLHYPSTPYLHPRNNHAKILQSIACL